MIKLTGIWINTDKQGRKYMKGKLGTADILIYKNSYKKEGDKQPDYNLFLAENKKKEQSDQANDPFGV